MLQGKREATCEQTSHIFMTVACCRCTKAPRVKFAHHVNALQYNQGIHEETISNAVIPNVMSLRSLNFLAYMRSLTRVASLANIFLSANFQELYIRGKSGHVDVFPERLKAAANAVLRLKAKCTPFDESPHCRTSTLVMSTFAMQRGLCILAHD